MSPCLTSEFTDALPELVDDRPDCVHPRQPTDHERQADAHERLRVLRRVIAQTCRQLRAGQDVGADLDALLAAEDRCMDAVRTATRTE